MNKKYLIPLFAILLIGVVVATGFAYFHQTDMTLTVTEARSSADVPFELSCYSGETVTEDLVIHNAANVPLKALLTYEETLNEAGVTYTNNLPQTVNLAPEADTTVTVTMTCDETTEAGVVEGTINYQKTA